MKVKVEFARFLGMRNRYFKTEEGVVDRVKKVIANYCKERNWLNDIPYHLWKDETDGKYNYIKFLDDLGGWVWLARICKVC